VHNPTFADFETRWQSLNALRDIGTFLTNVHCHMNKMPRLTVTVSHHPLPYQMYSINRTAFVHVESAEPTPHTTVQIVDRLRDAREKHTF
jgi:hypothetical protein